MKPSTKRYLEMSDAVCEALLKIGSNEACANWWLENDNSRKIVEFFRSGGEAADKTLKKINENEEQA